MANPNQHPPGLTEEDIIALKKLAERYIQIKAFITYAEECQIDHNSDILVYKELRDCLDHVMRVLFSRLSSQAEHIDNPEEYRNINLDKAIGHAYRAAFDALDVTILSLKEHISSNLAPYEHNTVVHVIPDYYKLKIKLNELVNRAADRRRKKDIGKITENAFDEYAQDVDDLKKMHQTILYATPELDAHKTQQKYDKLKTILWSIALVFLGAVLKHMFG